MYKTNFVFLFAQLVSKKRSKSVDRASGNMEAGGMILNGREIKI